MGIPYKYPVAEISVGEYIGTGSPPFVAIWADIGCSYYASLLQFWDFLA